MKPLQSSLEHQVESFDKARDRLAAYQFTVGGNWDYDSGYFDRPLDEARKVWLRIPFQSRDGAIDAETEETRLPLSSGSRSF
ncbi:YugN family protein [Gordoniibacillus kamchatkensis]|uniref:YugN family protein n=1 Tax=Gordoniibacillus kamchatkensis TaxID=1590651 RepID=UPI001E4A6401|nr:YugN family protein [Paenibacillus sp. VKM B-2647]